MLRESLLVAGFLGAVSFPGEARGGPAAPPNSWVGVDGRTYYAPPETDPRLDKKGRPRRKVNVGMTVAGGIFAGLGAMAFVGGLAGYFATIDCDTSSSPYGFGSVRCTDHKEILFVSLGGVVSAAAIGTPLLVVGLRRPEKNEIEKPAEDASVSFTVGAVSGLTVKF